MRCAAIRCARRYGWAHAGRQMAATMPVSEARYIEPPLPPAPPSMRKARSRQSSLRSLLSWEGAALLRGLRGDRRWSASVHRFPQALLPWHFEAQAVCATAALLTAAAPLVARRHVIRAVRMGCCSLAGHLASEPSCAPRRLPSTQGEGGPNRSKFCPAPSNHSPAARHPATALSAADPLTSRALQRAGRIEPC